MNFSYLKTLVKVVELKGVSKAAQVLNLTQPAVSKQIGILESYYETEILDRSRRRFTLTEGGKVIHQHALAILSEQRDAFEALNELSTVIKGDLFITASTIPGHYIIPRMIGPFIMKYPQIRVTIEITDSGKVLKLLYDDKIHLGAVGHEVKNRRVSSKMLASDQLVLITPPEHPLAKKGCVNAGDLLEYNLVWREPESGTRRVIEEKLNKAGIDLGDLKIAAELGSNESVVTAVQAGLGISIVSMWAVREKEQAGKLRCLLLKDVPLKRNLFLVHLKNRKLTRAAKAFLDFMAD
ncbi:MAG TPA: selenium metabolism-associated LysR family transcriptional regulator [Clostridia bacterium]|nr:selenium metabolism-associated LysR family transcriptional regulator [Clostridia bacterium]